MSEAWNLEALRAQVKIRQPETSKRLVQIINSLGRSRDIFTYHKCHRPYPCLHGEFLLSD
jgi:hypothetical protein